MYIKVCSYKAAHYLNEEMQKTTFEKHNLNKFGVTKIFISKTSKFPSWLTLISWSIVQENKIFRALSLLSWFKKGNF